MTNAQLDAEKSQYLGDWDHRNEAHLTETSHKGEIDMEFDANDYGEDDDSPVGRWHVSLTCCDEQGNAACCGIDEQFVVGA